MAAEAAAMRPRAGTDPVVLATKTALRSLGRRALQLDAERKELDVLLAQLVADVAPELLALSGVGTDSAAALLAAADDNPARSRPKPPGLGCAA